MSTDFAIELILDASQSMTRPFDGSTRIAKAKELLINIVTNDLPDGTPIALRVFGANGGCSSDLIVPLSALDRKKMIEAIESVQAIGDTNIAGSLIKVTEDLTGVKRPYAVLVTDGEETCGGNVEAAIQRLKETGVDVRMDIIGITEDPRLEKTFETWAKSCGGAYLGSKDSDELEKALKSLFMKPLPNRPYLIESQFNQHVVDVTGASKAEGVAIILWPRHGKSNQQWFFEDAGNGAYYIRSANSGLYLQFGNNKDNWNNLIQAKKTNQADQQFMLVPDKFGGVAIRSKSPSHANKAISIGDKLGAGHYLVPWDPTGQKNQSFKLVHLS